ncbi:MAG: biotin/lipoyl-containing protein [Hyphomicrobiales bacterium]
MSTEIKINDKISNVKLVQREGSRVVISVNDKQYEIDLAKVGEDIYSILYKGKSYNLELVPQKSHKNYLVHTHYHSYDVSIIDSEAKYLMNRNKGATDDSNVISSPMPGKIVSIPVEVGQKLEENTTVVIVSAMKMESEYKVHSPKTVVKILAKEGDTIESNQPLVIVE